MSPLTPSERVKLERLLCMESGYVLGFSNTSFESLFHHFDVEIYAEKYDRCGTSKANRLRAFWEMESDGLVGRVLLELIDSARDPEEELRDSCIVIANRLVAGGPNLLKLSEAADRLDAANIKRQLSRIEGAVSSDPELAIGSAKELVETCCKTILEERGIAVKENIDMSELVKATLKELKLTRDEIPELRQGSETIKRIVSNLNSIAKGVNDLRNWYGTGHGRTGKRVLSPRHAQLAVGSASTLVQFLFDTHNDQVSKSGPSH